MRLSKRAGKLKVISNKLKKIELRYFLSFLLALGLIASSVVLLKIHRSAPAALVQAGRADLSDLPLDEQQVYELTGDFFFYPDLFLEDSPAGAGQLVFVPGVWNDYYGQESDSAGFASYRLLIEVPEPGLYAVRTKTIRAAAKVFLNGRLAAQLGQPTQSLADFRPESRYLLGLVQLEGTQLEIVIQVANFGYGKGGILKPLEFGRAEAVLARQRWEQSFELFMVILLILLGILALVIYFWRGRQRAVLFFVLAAIFLGLYLSTMNNQVLTILITYDFFARLKLQSTLMVLSAGCFLLFARFFYPDQVSRRICRSLLVVLSLAFLLGLNDPRWTLSLPVELIQLLLVVLLGLVYSYISWCLLKALWQKVSASEFLLVVLAAVAAYWLLLFAKILLDVEIAYWPELYLLVALLGAIFLIGNRLHREFLLATRLTEERLEQELKVFFSQISPHFLYNTINTIIALSYEDAEKTRQALHNLALYFRGKLELHLQKGLIPLSQELDMVRAYLEIEKLRHAKLEIELEIDESVSVLIPPLTIQPLAENAIRHGIMPKPGGGTVKLIVTRQDPGLVSICVEDDGAGISKEMQKEIMAGTADGLGLGNVLQKIRLMPQADVRLESQAGQGTRIRIILPEEEDNASYSD